MTKYIIATSLMMFFFNNMTVVDVDYTLSGTFVKCPYHLTTVTETEFIFEEVYLLGVVQYVMIGETGRKQISVDFRGALRKLKADPGWNYAVIDNLEFDACQPVNKP